MSNIVFIISGMVCFIEAIFRIYKKSKYISVQGLCIQVYTRGSLPNKKKCGYQYVHNGFTYEYYDKYYYPYFKAKIGDTYNLFINRDEPKACITPSYIAVTRDLVIVGMMLIIAPFFFV